MAVFDACIRFEELYRFIHAELDETERIRYKLLSPLDNAKRTLQHLATYLGTQDSVLSNISDTLSSHIEQIDALAASLNQDFHDKYVNVDWSNALTTLCQ